MTVTGKMGTDEENSHFHFVSAFLICINVKNKNPVIFVKLSTPMENMTI